MIISHKLDLHLILSGSICSMVATTDEGSNFDVSNRLWNARLKTDIEQNSSILTTESSNWRPLLTLRLFGHFGKNLMEASAKFETIFVYTDSLLVESMLNCRTAQNCSPKLSKDLFIFYAYVRSFWEAMAVDFCKDKSSSFRCQLQQVSN